MQQFNRFIVLQMELREVHLMMESRVSVSQHSVSISFIQTKHTHIMPSVIIINFIIIIINHPKQ